jgi:hypothetical protein
MAEFCGLCGLNVSLHVWDDFEARSLCPEPLPADLDRKVELTRQGAPAPKANDLQVAGDHYKKLNPQPWDVIAAWGLGFFDGNVVKYIARFREKGGLQDLQKAAHYLAKLIEQETKK